ncbi:MAG: hypothetical protein AAF532_13230 [Planctomycetota bacterium]
MKTSTIGCLFTREELSSKTPREHSIPQKLGGKITSKQSIGATANHWFGANCDKYLVDAFDCTLRCLGNFVSKSARLGVAEVRNEEEPGLKLELEYDGSLGLGRPTVLERFVESGRPKAVAGKNENKLRSILGSGELYSYKERLAPGGKLSFASGSGLSRTDTISVRLELAALKALVVSFDTLLEGGFQFTRRHEPLGELWEKIADSISRGRGKACGPLVDTGFFSRIFLGLQFDPVFADKYETIINLSGVERADFGHTLIASGGGPEKHLDLLLWLFDAEPYAFRVSSNFQGRPFTAVVHNPIFSDGIVAGPVLLESEFTLGRKRLHTSLACEAVPDASSIASRVHEGRAELHARAYRFQHTHDFELLGSVINAEIKYCALPEDTLSDVINRYVSRHVSRSPLFVDREMESIVKSRAGDLSLKKVKDFQHQQPRESDLSALAHECADCFADAFKFFGTPQLVEYN